MEYYKKHRIKHETFSLGCEWEKFRYSAEIDKAWSSNTMRKIHPLIKFSALLIFFKTPPPLKNVLNFITQASYKSLNRE